MSSAPAILAAQSLRRRNRDGAGWLISDVSLALCPGERLAIVGATGSGKTLLLRSLALLDPVDAGEVLWHAAPIADAQVPQFRRQAIYLQQRPALVDGTVEDNLRLPYALHTQAGHEFDRRQALELLALLGRDETFLARSERDLSGGERQLVAFVRAVQLEPEVLLLDEPTASLDADSAQAIETLVDRWYESSAGKRALIWVSHDPRQAERVSQRVLSMSRGRLNAESSNAERPS